MSMYINRYLLRSVKISSLYKMTSIRAISLLFFSIPLCLNATLSSAESADNKTTAQQASVDGSKLTGYFLVSPPSVNKKKLEVMRKKLRSDMPRAEIRKIIEERIVYRLVAHCFESMAPAKKMRTALFHNSRTPFIVKTDNTYCVVESSHMTIQGAFAEQRQLAEKHVDANIVRVSLPLTQWQVKSRDVYDLRDAVRMVNTVSRKGMVITLEPLEN